MRRHRSEQKGKSSLLARTMLRHVGHRRVFDIAVLIVNFYTMERSRPPSARRAAPLVAEESGLARKVTRFAISDDSIRRWRSELERCFSKNSCSACSGVGFRMEDIFSRNSTMPSERVGPGRTVFTVTALPLVSSARPREIASCEDLVTP